MGVRSNIADHLANVAVLDVSQNLHRGEQVVGERLPELLAVLVPNVQLLPAGVDLRHKVVQVVDFHAVGRHDCVLIAVLGPALDAGDKACVTVFVVVNPDVGVVPPGRGRVRHLKLELAVGRAPTGTVAGGNTVG